MLDPLGEPSRSQPSVPPPRAQEGAQRLKYLHGAFSTESLMTPGIQRPSLARSRPNKPRRVSFDAEASNGCDDVKGFNVVALRGRKSGRFVVSEKNRIQRYSAVVSQQDILPSSAWQPGHESKSKVNTTGQWSGSGPNGAGLLSCSAGVSGGRHR